MIKKITFSCSIFGGFSFFLPVTNVASESTIVAEATKQLEQFLRFHNLFMLLDTLNTKKGNFHIHDFNTQIEGDEIFVCREN